MSADLTKELAAALECSFFAPEATRADIEKLCATAREKNFRAVCVNGSRVELTRTLLEDSPVQVVALVGFPLGAADSDANRYETEIAVDQGAHEIDFVVNIGRLKDGDHQYVLREMRDIVEAADERPVKAIFETHLLTPEEKTLACQLMLDSGAKFLVTATDFHSPAITLEEIKFLRTTLGESFGLKAAGKIRNAQTATHFLAAGATLIGAHFTDFAP